VGVEEEGVGLGRLGWCGEEGVRLGGCREEGVRLGGCRGRGGARWV
jgi:hypothetical protein